MGKNTGYAYWMMAPAGLVMSLALWCGANPIDTSCFLEEKIPGYRRVMEHLGDSLLDGTNFVMVHIQNLIPGAHVEYQTQAQWRKQWGLDAQPKVDLCASMDSHQWVLMQEQEVLSNATPHD